MSCSYGPGRYDHNYEEKGNDYPVGFVRWTEQRNFEAVLDLMSTGALDVKPLVSHRYSIDDAVEAYTVLDDKSALGIVLDYSNSDSVTLCEQIVSLKESKGVASPASLAVIGAGNYASRILIPTFKSAGASRQTPVSYTHLTLPTILRV